MSPGGPRAPGSSARQSIWRSALCHEERKRAPNRDQTDTREAADSCGRDHFVLVGLETDVCVAQSALGLRAAGYRVTVVEDACGSPPPNHETGVQRMRDAGITVTSTKGLFYEWIRDLETMHRVKSELNVPVPTGITL